MASRELLGRDHEIELIDGQLARAHEGAGSVCVVVGPAGIGKSALLEEAKSHATAAGFQVLCGVGYELERGFGFGVVRQLFDPVIPPDAPPSELMTGAAELAAIPLGRRRPADQNGADAAAPPPLSAMWSLYWLTEGLAQRAPTLIVVDDAQWVDSDSGQFVAYLARRLEGLRVVILVASRPAGEHVDPAFLAQLRKLPDVTIENLAPLTEDQVRSLMIGRGFNNGMHTDFVAACHLASGGNPFLLGELATRLRDDGVTGSAAEASRIGTLAPEDVISWVQERLRVVGKAATALASAYAVLDTGAELRDAGAISRLDGSELSRAADALIVAEILSPSDPYDFVHPLVRSAVYQSLTPARRAEAHFQAARLTFDRHRSPALVAAHLLWSDPGSSEWTVEALRRAARDAVATGAPGSAVLYLERALRESVALAVRAELLVELGDAQLRAGSIDGFGSLREAIEIETAGRRRAETYLKLGRGLFAIGEFAAAHDAFEAGLSEDISHDDELFIELSAWAVTDTASDPVLDEGAQSRLRLLVEGSSPGATRTERLLLAHLAYRSSQTGERPAEAVARLARRALAGEAFLEDCAVDYVPYGAACLALLGAGELGTALSELDRAVIAGQKRGSRPAVGWLSMLRGVAHYARGHMPEAIADLEQASNAMLEVWGRVRPDVRAILANCLVETGELDGAEESLRLNAEEQAWSDMHPGSIAYNFALGRLRFAQRKFEEALEVLLRCEEWTLRTKALNPAGHLSWRSEAALAALHLGDRARAREILADSRQRASAFGAPVALAIVVRTTASVEGANLDLFDEAVRLLEGSGADRELARTLADQGAALRRAGRALDARRPLERALDLASRCGATAIKRVAHRELVDAGGRPRGERISGVESLTPSERRVAFLGADGLTNTQIAQQLFVTRRTVESHLTNTFRKLDISRRDELRGRLDEDGGDSPGD
jgi:DNA-binding CsgD family transcriptional regulator